MFSHEALLKVYFCRPEYDGLLEFAAPPTTKSAAWFGSLDGIALTQTPPVTDTPGLRTLQVASFVSGSDWKPAGEYM